MKIPSEELQTLKDGIEETKSLIENLSFPTSQMLTLSETMNSNIGLLRQPLQRKVEHHHHFPKILFATCCLFIIGCILSAGWFMTSKNLKQYKVNDTKYLYLKLNSTESLRKSLHVIDSYYTVKPDFRERVLRQEEINRERFELQQKEKKNEIDLIEKRK